MKLKLNVFVFLSVIFVLLLNVAGFAVKSESPIPHNKVPGSVESKARRLMNSLKQAGFEVERGYFKLYTNDDCPVSFEEMGMCYGNNPAAPYVTFCGAELAGGVCRSGYRRCLRH